MKPKLAIVLIAVIIGIFAALGVNNYISKVNKQAMEGQESIKVWVANKDIEKGTSIEDIQANHLAELRSIPRKYVATQAISSMRSIEGQVLSTSLSSGEQLTTGKFKRPSEAGLSYTIPKGFIAVSIPCDNSKGVAGLLKPGDIVTVFATFKPGPNGEDMTKVILQGVKVTAVDTQMEGDQGDSKTKTAGISQTIASSSSSSNSGNSGTGPKTVTLALSSSDAEKLVFAQENGKIWLGLQPSPNSPSTVTRGITIKTIFE